MPAKKQSLFINLALACASVLVTLLCLEIAFRLFGPDYHRFNANSSEYYTNPRGYHVLLRRDGDQNIFGLRYRATRNGFRLPDAGTPAEADAHRLSPGDTILTLGDSFTFGRGVRYRDTYPVALETLLQQNGIDAGIRNCGVVGVDIEEINRILQYTTSYRNYPLVIYGFVLNDFGLPDYDRIVGCDFIDINNQNTYNRWRDISRLYNFACHVMDKRRLHAVTLQSYLKAFEEKWAAPKFELLARMNRDIKARGGTMLVVLFPLLYDFDDYPFKKNHAEIADFCGRKAIPMLDLLEHYAEHEAEDLWANPTDHHPNETAHRITARAIYDYLREHDLIDLLEESSRQ